MKNSGFYPGAAPTVANGAITVDLMLQEPARISKYIADITALKMFTDRLFGHSDAQGGAILYEVNTENQMLADDHTGIIAPGGEYPELDATPGEPKVAQVKKLGGKFSITDEAKARNDMALLQRRAQRISNTMVFDVDNNGMLAIKKAIQEYGSYIPKVESSGWVSMNKTEKLKQTAAKSIRAELNAALAAGEKTQMGYLYNLLVLHTDDALQLANTFDTNDAQDAFLKSQGLEVISSPLATPGEGLLVAEGQVGTIGMEEPISTATWRDEARDLTWTKVKAVLEHVVTDPMAMVRLTGLGA
jgi:hypothetical protein